MDKKTPMAKVVVRREMCKACGYCVSFCPKDVLAISNGLNLRGLHYVYVVHGDRCTGCGICGIVCPDVAMEVYM